MFCTAKAGKATAIRCLDAFILVKHQCFHSFLSILSFLLSHRMHAECKQEKKQEKKSKNLFVCIEKFFIMIWTFYLFWGHWGGAFKQRNCVLIARERMSSLMLLVCKMCVKWLSLQCSWLHWFWLVFCLCFVLWLTPLFWICTFVAACLLSHVSNSIWIKHR